MGSKGLSPAASRCMVLKMSRWSWLWKSSSRSTAATVSNSSLANIRPPSTACSASREWGSCCPLMGFRDRSAMEPLPENDTKRRQPRADAAFRQCLWQLLTDNHYLDGLGHLGVELDVHLELAQFPQHAGRQFDLALAHLDAGGADGIGDVAGADGAEQLAFITGVAGEGHGGEGRQLGSAGLGLGLALGGGLFQLRATLLESRDVVGGGEDRLALGNQIVAAITGTHGHLGADATQLAYFFQQNDFHLQIPLDQKPRLLPLAGGNPGAKIEKAIEKTDPDQH